MTEIHVTFTDDEIAMLAAEGIDPAVWVPSVVKAGLDGIRRTQQQVTANALETLLRTDSTFKAQADAAIARARK